MAKRRKKLLLETAPPRRWPNYAPLAKAVRHAIYIQPLEQEMEATLQDRPDEATMGQLDAALRRNVDELQAQYDAAQEAARAE